MSKQLLFNAGGGGEKTKRKQTIRSNYQGRNTTYSSTVSLPVGTHLYLLVYATASPQGSNYEPRIRTISDGLTVASISGGATMEVVGDFVRVNVPSAGSYTLRGNTGLTAQSGSLQCIYLIEFE